MNPDSARPSVVGSELTLQISFLFSSWTLSSADLLVYPAHLCPPALQPRLSVFPSPMTPCEASVSKLQFPPEHSCHWVSSDPQLRDCPSSPLACTLSTECPHTWQAASGQSRLSLRFPAAEEASCSGVLFAGWTESPGNSSRKPEGYTAFLSLNSAAVPPHEQARAPFQVGSTLLLGKPLLGKVFGHWGNVPPFNISLSGAWVKEPNAYPEEAYHLFFFLFCLFLFFFFCICVWVSVCVSVCECRCVS